MHVYSVEEAARGGLVGFLKNLVHSLTPHDRLSLYVLGAVVCVVAVIAVYVRSRYTGSTRYLEHGWHTRAAGYAVPLPIYGLLILAPFDEHLLGVLLQEELIVALAGLYGLTETFNDVRGIPGRAHDRRRKGTS